jgi:hypothetical protein
MCILSGLNNASVTRLKMAWTVCLTHRTREGEGEEEGEGEREREREGEGEGEGGEGEGEEEGCKGWGRYVRRCEEERGSLLTFVRVYLKRNATCLLNWVVLCLHNPTGVCTETF